MRSVSRHRIRWHLVTPFPKKFTSGHLSCHSIRHVPHVETIEWRSSSREPHQVTGDDVSLSPPLHCLGNFEGSSVMEVLLLWFLFDYFCCTAYCPRGLLRPWFS